MDALSEQVAIHVALVKCSNELAVMAVANRLDCLQD